MGKPVTEVMAQLFWESSRQRLGDELTHLSKPWEELTPELRAHMMSDMAEVTRFFGLFGLELRVENGKGFLYGSIGG